MELKMLLFTILVLVAIAALPDLPTHLVYAIVMTQLAPITIKHVYPGYMG